MRALRNWLQSIRMAFPAAADLSAGVAARATPHPGTVRAMTCLAGLAALTIAAVVPVSWFLAARAGLGGEVGRHVHALLDRVEEAAHENPALWNALADSPAAEDLNPLDFAQLIDNEDASKILEHQRVLSAGGRILIETATTEPLAWPLVRIRLTVHDATTRLGEVEVARSLRPDLVSTAAAAFGSCTLGLLMFLLLRVAPLRMLSTAVEQASFVSAHDMLTGLPNRRLFQDRLQQALLRSRRNGGLMALFYMDLDHFKAINDLLGHAAGDATLRTVAERLGSCLRAGDTLARLGGDEFAIIVTELKQSEEAGLMATRLIAAVAPPIDLEGTKRQVGLSVGISVVDPRDPVLADQLMKQADIALYQSKEAGRGCLRFFKPEMNTALRERHDMENDLRMAIAGSGLVVYYQPQVDLATGALVGAEALVRWNRPGHGFTQPDRFIGLAEDTGLIVPLGTWVLREACRRAANWPARISVAVNVSPIQLRHSGFCQALAETLVLTRLAPSRLWLEVTESVLLHDTEAVLNTLHRLREMGVRLALDDFGTGYSSLSYLQKFRFDKIKIDRSFVARLGEEANAASIVAAIIAMAKALEMWVIAEGIESSAQADILRSAGCSEVQGYYFSRPLPDDAFEAMIRPEPNGVGESPLERDRLGLLQLQT